MNESPTNDANKERAHRIEKALSIHDYRAMRRLMKDKTRNLANPVKFDVDKLPDYPPVSDRRKRRKAKAEDGT